MVLPRDKILEWVQRQRLSSGLGVCCCEAQADGVPCSGPGSDCARCQHAVDAYTEAMALERGPNPSSPYPPNHAV